MASYILRITSANTTKNIPISRLMALRTEAGAKYAILENNGQLAQGITLSQKGTTLTVEAGGQKLVYLNGYYAPGTNASIETASGMAEGTSSATSTPTAATTNESITAASTASGDSTIESTTSSATSNSSGGWMSGMSGLGGNTGMLLLGGVAVAGIAAAAAGGGGNSDNKGSGNTTNAPTISGISLAATGAADNYLIAGDVVTATVAMSKETIVVGNPVLKINIGGTEVDAVYSSGSGSKNLVFTYTISANQTDVDGLSITAGEVFLPSGASMKDNSGADAVKTYAAVANQNNLKVDSVAPAINSIAISSTAPNDGYLGSGETITFDVAFSKTVTVTGTPQLKVMIGSTEVNASYTSGSGSNTLKFSYTVTTGLSDNNGISIAANSLALNTGTIKDVLNNSAILTHSTVADNNSFMIDSAPPTVMLLNPSPILLEGISRTNGLDGGAQLKAIGNTGKFAAIWRGADNVGTAENNHSVFIQLFNADGSKSGATIQINSKIEALATDFAPEITSLNNAGSFVATWVDYSNNKREIVVQKFNSDGSKATNNPIIMPSFVATFDPPQDTAPKIAPLTDGSFILTWTAVDQAWNVQTAVPNRSIYVQKFSVDGTLSGSATKINVNGTDSWDYNPEIIVIDNTGAYVLTWTGYDSNNDLSIYVQKFSASGSAVGTASKLEATNVNNLSDLAPKITALGNNGDYAVTWTGQDSTTGNDFSIFVQRFNNQGTAIGSTIMLEANGLSDQDDLNPNILALDTTGRFAITWQGHSDVDHASIYVQIFNADGTRASTTAIKLDSISIGTTHNTAPIIKTIAANGDFVVAWTGSRVEGGSGIYLQRFDINGTKIGTQIELLSPFNIDQINTAPSIAAINNDGQFAVSWQGIDQEGDKSIFVQTINQDGSFSRAVLSSETISVGDSISAQSSENGKIYLLNNKLSTSELLTDVARATPTLTHYWVATNASSNQTSSIATAGLVPGDYYLYSADANNNLSLASDHIVHISAIKSIKLDGATNVISGELGKNSVVTITATMYDAVDVSGTPTVQLDIGGSVVTANYISGSGSNTLKFSYTIVDGNIDTDGIAIVANGFSLNGGKLTEAGNSNKELNNFNYLRVSDHNNYIVDTQAPAVHFLNPGMIEANNPIDVVSDEAATLYMVKKGLTVNSVTDITALADNLWNQANANLPDDLISMPTTGLQAGEYVLYAVDRLGNFSKVASTDSVTISNSINTSIVVFDLINGVSSAHSGRTFNDSTSYTIYVRVNNSVDFGDFTKTDSNSWSAWKGSSALGDDDTVILVGSNAAITGNKNQAVDQIQLGSKAITWKTAGTGHAARLTDSGQFTRATPGLTAPTGVLLWSSQWKSINKGEALNAVYQTNMPAGLLTAQGLV